MLTPSFLGIIRKVLALVAVACGPLGFMFLPASSHEVALELARSSLEKGEKTKGKEEHKWLFLSAKRGFVFSQTKLLLLYDIKKEIRELLRL